MTPPAEPSKRRLYQIGGTQRTRGEWCFLCRQCHDDACSQDGWVFTGKLQAASNMPIVSLLALDSGTFCFPLRGQALTPSETIS